jgi:transcription termination factor NusB
MTSDKKEKERSLDTSSKITLKVNIPSPVSNPNFQKRAQVRSESDQVSRGYTEREEGIEDKKRKFENFLTYRKRLTRLSIAQSLYFHEQFLNFSTIKLNLEEEVNEVYRVTICFYKRMFFTDGKYGDNKKNKKLDERFLRNIIRGYIERKESIDSYIIKHIHPKWRLSSLNAVVRAGLRSAICEALLVMNPNYKIISSEYTSLIAGCITEDKEVAFFNAILDKILKEIIRQRS